ncbi:MAG: dipeptidase [Christensenellales bacterium]
MSNIKAPVRVCDAHCDTLYNLLTAPGSANDVTLERLTKGGVVLQTMAMYVGPAADLETFEARFVGMFAELQKLQDQGWRLVDDPVDIADDGPHMLLSIEGCEVFARGLHVIEEYRNRGVRMAAVTWNHPNALGTPHCVDATTGLTDYGLQAVREMQRLRIAVDISHLNEAGVDDIFLKTNAPPMASHSCARALRDHTRNLTDRQLRQLFGAGGFVGLNFFPLFITDQPVCTLDMLVDHIAHMYDLGGAGMVGFGSDFDGISSKPVGLDNPADFPNLLEALRRRGFGDKDVRDIAGQAFFDYFARI